MKRFVVFGGFVAAVVVLTALLRGLQHDPGDLRLNLWAPARLLLSRRDPYSLDNLAILSQEEGFTLYRSVWFPTAIGMLLPLGALPFTVAANLWLIANIALLCGCIAICLRGKSISSARGLAVGLGILFFPPLIAHLRLGQVSILVLFSLLLTTQHIKEGRFLLAGIIFSLSLVKPQLLVLVVPALAFHLFAIDRWQRPLVGFAVGVVIQTAPLFVTFPRWLLSYAESLVEAPRWMNPSILTISRICVGHEGLAWGSWLLIFIFALSCVIRLWKYATPAVAMVWTLGMTLIASPYVWSWDQVLLLPLVVTTATTLSGREAVAWWAGYVAIVVAFIVVRLTSSNVDYLYFWVPWVMVGFAVAMLRPKHGNVLQVFFGK